MGGEGREGTGAWGLCLSPAGGDPGGGLRGGSQQNIHQFPRCVLSRSRAPLIGQQQGRGSLVIATGPGLAPLVLLLFWVTPGAKMSSSRRQTFVTGYKKLHMHDFEKIKIKL